MGKQIKYIPKCVTDLLMHGKDSDRTERILLPITRYGNILNAPNVVSEDLETRGAPFHLLETDSIEMSEDEIRQLCGRII